MIKMIFFNIGWMKWYKGLKNDKIIGGGKDVDISGFGHEMFNFLPCSGHMYGFVMPVKTKRTKNVSINIERLGAKNYQESIDKVLVVWVARSLIFGTVIVGWYKNAVIYRNEQAEPGDPHRQYKDHEFGYFIKAKRGNCVLLPIENRIFRIPRGKGWMGQSNVWFADQKRHFNFKRKALEFINNNGEIIAEKKRMDAKSRSWQIDPLKRQKVEEIAIKTTTKHYRKIGFYVKSFERNNIGWDLEATLNNKMLRLEVKGLSGNDVTIELTPKEYESCNAYPDSYRICIVTNAFNKPKLTIFSYSRATKKWEDNNGNPLTIIEIKGARMFQ